MSQSEDASRKERALAAGASLLEGTLGRALSKVMDRVGLDLRVEPGAQIQVPAAPDAAAAQPPAECEGSPASPSGAPEATGTPPGPRQDGLDGLDDLVALATWVLGRRYLETVAAEAAPGADLPAEPLYTTAGPGLSSRAPAAAPGRQPPARPGAAADRAGAGKPTPPRGRGFTFRY